MNTVILVLAAGQSRRFGGVKQLSQVYHGGKNVCLLTSTLMQLRPLRWPMLVVTRPDLERQKVITELKTQSSTGDLDCDSEEQVHWYNSPNCVLGMGHSIADGVNWIVKHRPETTHMMLTLADQVALESSDYKNLMQKSADFPDSIICAKSPDGISAPAIFPQRYFLSLAELSGDKGAKAIILKHIKKLKKVVLNDAAIDIDTQEDLKNWNLKML